MKKIIVFLLLMTTNITFAASDVVLTKALGNTSESEHLQSKQGALNDVHQLIKITANAGSGMAITKLSAEESTQNIGSSVNRYSKHERQSLLDIYHQALASDPTLASALSSNQSAQELIEQNKALFRPNINFSANVSASETNIQYIGLNVFRTTGRKSFNNRKYAIEARQAIFHKDNWDKLAQAKTKVSQAAKQYHLSQQDLILRVTEAYFAALIAQDEIDLIRAQKTAILGQLKQAQANFEVGNSTITDVNEAQARYDLVISQEIAAENSFLIAQRSIQAITNQIPETLATVKSNIVVSQLDQSIEDWQQIARINNLNVQIQQDALAVAEKEISVAKAGYLPTLDAVASYSDSYASGSANGFGSRLKNGTIGLELNVPLYQGGGQSSAVRSAAFEKGKAEQELELALRNVDLETQRHYFNLHSTVAQVRALEHALSSTQSQLDSTTLGYEVGVRSSIDVLDAQQQLYSAKRDLLEARYNYLLNIVRLKFSAGLLSIVDLEEINNELLTEG